MQRSSRRVLRDYLLTVAVAVSLAFGIRTFVVEAYRIPTHSMSPTLLPGDTIFVSKWLYTLRKNLMPERGEIVLFQGKPKDSEPKAVESIKRVVGLPGDKVQIKNGELLLNEKYVALEANQPTQVSAHSGFAQSDYVVQHESFHTHELHTVEIPSTHTEDFGPVTVPPDSVLLMSDFRGDLVADQNKRRASSTVIPKRKNCWSIEPVASIRGKAFYIWLSIDAGTPSRREEASWLPRFRLERMFRRI